MGGGPHSARSSVDARSLVGLVSRRTLSSLGLASSSKRAHRSASRWVHQLAMATPRSREVQRNSMQPRWSSVSVAWSSLCYVAPHTHQPCGCARTTVFRQLLLNMLTRKARDEHDETAAYARQFLLAEWGTKAFRDEQVEFRCVGAVARTSLRTLGW